MRSGTLPSSVPVHASFTLVSRYPWPTSTTPTLSGLHHPYSVSVLVTSYPPSHMVARGSRPGPLRPSTPLRSMGAALITLQISKRYSESTGRSRAHRRGRPRQPQTQDGSSRQPPQRTPPTRNRSGRTHQTGSRPTSISSTQAIIKPKCLHRSSQASTRRTWLLAGHPQQPPWYPRSERATPTRNAGSAGRMEFGSAISLLSTTLPPPTHGTGASRTAGGTNGTAPVTD